MEYFPAPLSGEESDILAARIEHQIGQHGWGLTKKWAGLGKEFFTSADNYVIALEEGKTQLPDAGPLLLAAGLAIDIVYKEK